MAGGERQSADKETGLLFATDDGGLTWSRVDTAPNGHPIRSVRFFSDSEGWLTTDYDVYRTHDGGKNWASVLSYPENSRKKQENARFLTNSVEHEMIRN
jgi:photosystem II stability/assembly factor-like uncharacterized protein